MTSVGEKDIILMLVGNWVLATMAWLGLLGWVTEKMRWPKGKSGGTKLYRGRNARKWGMVFFLLFGGATIVLLSSWQGKNIFYFLMWLWTVLLGYPTARFLRKRWPFEVK